MSVEPHPKYKDHWIIIHYPWGRGKNPATGKPERRRERVIYGPCSFEVAKRYEQELIRAAGKLKAKVQPANPTVAEILVDFCSDYKLRVSPTTYRDFESAWEKWLLPSFGHLRLTQITSVVVNNFKGHAKSTLKYKSINKILSYLSAILAWAHRQGHCERIQIDLFPAKMVAPPPLMVPTPDEIQRLITALPPDNRGALATVMYYAGLRLGDANKITGAQVNLEAGYMIVVGKGAKQRMIPLTAELRAVIEPRMNPGLLWPNPKTGKPYRDIGKLLENTARRLGITKRITHHMLRHSFGTHMVQAGASSFAVQMLMGHSSPQVTQRYVHLATDFLGGEMGRLSKAPQNAPPEKEKAATE